MNPPVLAPASRQRRPRDHETVLGEARRAHRAAWWHRARRRAASTSAARRRSARPSSTWVATLRATIPPTVTSPAATRSAACCRDRARPRRTSSASSRRRTIGRCLDRRGRQPSSPVGAPAGSAGAAHRRRQRLEHLLEDLGVLAHRTLGERLERTKRGIDVRCTRSTRTPRSSSDWPSARGPTRAGASSCSATLAGVLGLSSVTTGRLLLAFARLGSGCWALGICGHGVTSGGTGQGTVTLAARRPRLARSVART